MKVCARRCKFETGFSLIELIAFIVIVSLLVVALFTSLSTSGVRAPTAGQIDFAAEIAQERLELILAQRRLNGFASFVDPCPGPTVCTPPAGYAVSASIAGNWSGDANYKVITVDVTGIFSASVSALVANY